MRTEEEILKDFEKLGYVLLVNNDNELFLEKKGERQPYYSEYYRIRVYKSPYVNSYEKYVSIIESGKSRIMPVYFYLEEHKLLNELFTIWGWL